MTMDLNKLEQANELAKIIHTTEKELNNLLEMRKKIREVRENRHYDDGMFNFCISQYSDGSGVKCSFTRYYGNAELLDVIIDCVTEQLSKFKKEFAEI